MRGAMREEGGSWLVARAGRSNGRMVIVVSGR